MRPVAAVLRILPVVAALTANVVNADSSSSASVSAEQHLRDGDEFLAAGKFQEALGAYDEAARADGDSYMVYFKRATIAMARGRDAQAIEE